MSTTDTPLAIRTYTYVHPDTGRPVYTRTETGDHSITRWHSSGRVTRERFETWSTDDDGTRTGVWVPDDTP